MEVYSLTEDGFAHSFYKSRGQNKTTMYLNLYQNHVSYIRNFAGYAQKYQCKTSDRHFNHAGNLNKHQRNCANQTKYVYPGGFYQPTESVFERLDQYNIHVPDEDRTYPWFVCYDFEAILEKTNERPTEKLTWTQRHVPISVSMCSNVEGYSDPVCIVEPNQDKLVIEMVETLTNIALQVYEMSEEKWSWVLRAINDKIEKTSGEDLEEDLSDDLGGEAKEQELTPNHPLKRLYAQFEGYMSQVPVIGFNSAKYDLSLIKQFLAKYLKMHEDKPSFVIKKNNTYTYIAAKTL